MFRAAEKRFRKRAVETGFFDTEWFGRFTCISERPVFLVDGAHNEDAAKRLRESIEAYFPGRKAYLHNGCVSR